MLHDVLDVHHVLRHAQNKTRPTPYAIVAMLHRTDDRQRAVRPTPDSPFYFSAAILAKGRNTEEMNSSINPGNKEVVKIGPITD